MAHGALTTPSGGHDDLRMFLGYNTLPDPPFPLVGYLQYDMGQRADVDLVTLLSAAAESMRAQPVPPPEAFDESRRRVAAAMRVDAIVMVVPARALAPQHSEAARALWANLAEGYYRPGDAEACVDAREASVALAVDREGAQVLLMAERDPSGAHAAPTRVEGEPHGALFDLLGDVLEAQYTWTKAAFAL